MELDFEPVYSVEQIHVPLGLPDLLKKFTKEVLRAQPANLEEFAFNYFQKLLKLSKDKGSNQPPSIHQIQGVWNAVKGKETLKQSEIAETCSLNGISLSIIERAFQVGGFSAEAVDPREVLMLLITMSVKSTTAVLDAMFKVFGHEGGSMIGIPLFFKLFFFIAKRDHTISPDSINELTKDLAERQEVSYNDLKSSPHLQNYLAKK